MFDKFHPQTMIPSSATERIWLRNTAKDVWQMLGIPILCDDISRNRKTIVYSISYANKYLFLL